MVCPFCGDLTAKAGENCTTCGRALPPDVLPSESVELSRPPSSAQIDEGGATLAVRPTPASRISRFSPGPLDKGQIISGRYHVIRLLGKGGMGAVYHAWDEELGVGVALKVILLNDDEDPVAAEEMKRRFKKELLLARQITHRNVVRIHDIAEAEGMKFISMPYVEGQDLATMLKRGAMPVAQTLALAKQIVDGLAAAHDAGVVHRDLKPANIMVEDGEHALLMDFGIARSVRQGTVQGTVAGTVVGTIEYMAPEQAGGKPVDGRADIYSVGLIFYEMLTGRRQLAGDSAVSDLVARMSAPPPSVRTLKPEIPEAVDAVVTKCLQPDPVVRYQSARELLAALERLDSSGYAVPESRTTGARRMIAIATVAIVTVAGATYWLARRDPPLVNDAQRDPVSVLIANFDNRADDSVFDGTLEQALALAMEGAHFVSAFSRNDALRIASELKPGGALDEEAATLVARREGIKVILAGSITTSADGYTIRVRAIDPVAGSALSTAEEDADSKDEVLPAVNRVAVSMRRALGDATTESDAAAAAETFTAASLEAAHTYAQGQLLLWQGKQAEAVKAYLRAIELDPGMGRAYAGAAAVYGNMGRREEAIRFYELAMARIDRMTERERFRTRSGYWILTRNPEKAIEELTQLVEKYPADTAGLGNLAFAYFLRREMSRALEVGRKAVSIYPRNVLQRTNVALYAMYASDFETAAREAAAVLKINPSHAKGHLATALSELASDRVGQAGAAYDRLSALNPSLAATGAADVAAYEGRAADAASILEKSIGIDNAGATRSSLTARKLIALAHARSLQGRKPEARQLVAEALQDSNIFEVQVESALIYVDLGLLREATALADKLRGSLQPDPQAYAKVIDGLVHLARNQTREAVSSLNDAQKVADTWLGRLALGRAYLALSAYTEAYAAFESCLRRRGEATALFLDDLPTYRYLPPVHYYMGLAQKGLGSPQAAQSFKTFLAIKQRGDDPLVPEARAQLTTPTAPARP
jgi:tetratricopeptide (TPR) repeat protein